MNSDEILDFLEVLASTRSIQDKLELLALHNDDDALKSVLVSAYHSGFTFNKTFEKDAPGYGRERFDPRTLVGPYDGVLHGRLSYKSGVLYSRIVNKDLKCGIGAETINKVWPGLIFTMPYMRCATSIERPLEAINYSSGKWIAQPKKDGLYAEKRGDNLISRQGRFIISAKDAGIEELGSEYKFQGELTMRDARTMGILPRKESNGIFNSISQGAQLPEHLIVYYDVWDAITNYHDSTPYGDRLKRIPFDYCIWSFIINSNEERLKQRQKIIDSKLGEGLVLKHLDAPWVNGKSMLQIKDKPVHEVVLGIIGMNAGNGRLADTFGSLTCVSEDGRLLVNVSGFTDEERSEIVRDWSKWAYSSIGVKFKDVITSKSSDLYSLFEPRYAGPRFDKAPDTTESILERYYKG